MFTAHVRPGMTVLDIGCGAGFNTLGLARLVGPEGRVVGVDLQPRMLEMTSQRLEHHGLAARAELIECSPNDLRVDDCPRFDFAVAFWMVHEVGDPDRLFRQIRAVLKAGAPLLVVEPKLHVRRRAFDASVRVANGAGFVVTSYPDISLSHSVLLT